MTAKPDEETARKLLGGMTAACIARACVTGECVRGCLARVEIIAAALSAARREERTAIAAHLRERVGGGELGGGFAKLATSIERGDHAR